MLSLPCKPTKGKPSLPRLAGLLFVTLCLRSVHGATLREHRLRESESDPSLSPDSDMIKALEYIESLHQRTNSQEKPLLSMGNDGHDLDDVQKIGTVLRMAPDPTRARNDEEEDDVDEERSDDKSGELLQAVLSTLQQTEKASKPALLRPSSVGGGDVRNGMYPRVQKQQGIMPHKKMPLMFEDDEEGEGEEEEDEDDHESPFKRTNENVEEKYTPQNLATLQSVFDELDKFTNEKTSHKRQDEEDADEEEEEEGEDLFNLRNVEYDDDDDEDLADWGPIEEQGEDEEEGEDDKEALDRSLDYVDDEEEQDEEENERYPVRKSTDPDQVDYYLLKVLEKTEEEEQKRAIEEEEKKRAERRVTWYRNNIDPRVIRQLLQISQKYQIPPVDLLGMLKTGETISQGKKQQSNNKSNIWKTSAKKIYKIPQAKFYSRPPAARKGSPKNLQTEAIRNILGLNRDQTPVRKPYRSSASRIHTLTARPTGDAAPTQRRLPPSKTMDYDDTADGELAAYLAAQMLPRYPGLAYRYGKAGQKRDEVGQSTAGSFEQAMQDYLDQMDSDKEADIKRQSEDDERGDNTQEFDNKALMKLMSYLNPESEDNEKVLNGI
ncbi:secretogranin-2a [Corythoichthys intestinalis]|uniref:secretogranin-2a n=1 Tax=Corythoichthys intestinalis TaxID=161448 RepID=UPI0025A552DD|nr:secretogranin-2b [Corythoichthys intestinalis]